MSGGRVVVFVLVLVLDVALGLALVPRSGPALFSLVPPLTRLDAVGDTPLASGAQAARAGTFAAGVARVVERIGTPAQKRGLGKLMPRIDTDGLRLRVALEADAQAIALVLGARRVQAAIDHRGELADRYGEGRAWRDATEAR